jgi:hypothetical protein
MAMGTAGGKPVVFMLTREKRVRQTLFAGTETTVPE